MREFKIPRSPYEKGVVLYKKSKMTLNPGVTVLVGCNGCGKSTFVEKIAEQLEKNSIPYITYNNLHDGGTRAREKAMFYGEMDLFATLFCSSEGEQIVANMGSCATQMGQLARRNKDAKELWVLLDAVDSGLSIDNIVDVKEYLFKTVIEHNKDKDVYIVVSANEYEMCNGENCFDVYNGKYIRFSDYNDYRQFILNSKTEKDKRYEKKEKKTNAPE